ncbi:MAG TPA: neutral zinc metallopeptidase [Acidimicrobiales bacterium]|nr:neutral zinc metallopeptidase [Acidimicrobiales bacterium]
MVQRSQRSWSWRRVLALALPALALPTAGCVQEADENPLASGGPVGDRAERDDLDSGGSGTPVSPNDLDALVAAAIDDVEAYWTETYPEVYDGPFEPLAGGYHPYGPTTEMPTCGPVPVTYEEIAGNAFYCPSEDLIAWDQATLIPEINETFGGFTVGIVFAHEFAHAIQARAGVTGPRTIDLELQADCYAGAWTAHVADGGSDTFEVTDRELDSSVAGMVAIRDVPGTDPGDPSAHGSGFDRITAFQEGYESGPQHCADYEDSPRQTVQIPFTDADLTSANPGNLQPEDFGPGCPADLDERIISGRFESGEADDCGLASRLEADLNVNYTSLLEELGEEWTPIEDLVLVDPAGDEVMCGGDTLSGDGLRNAALYCEDENIVVIDGAGLTPELYGIGDFAFGAEVARLWAIAAQAQLGLEGEGVDDSLQADCLTGVYTRSIIPDPATDEPDSQILRISPGDLDEGIQGFIAYGDALLGETGTAFERTDALRTGVVDGLEGCERDYGELA